jgi:hypothetical protein
MQLPIRTPSLVTKSRHNSINNSRYKCHGNDTSIFLKENLVFHTKYNITKWTKELNCGRIINSTSNIT